MQQQERRPVQLTLAFDLPASRAPIVRAVLRLRLVDRRSSYKQIAAALGVGHKQVRDICRQAACQM